MSLRVVVVSLGSDGLPGQALLFYRFSRGLPSLLTSDPILLTVLCWSQLSRWEVSEDVGSSCRSSFTSEDDKGLACQIVFAPEDALPTFVAETVRYKGDILS
jgi:hypothetical protein